MLIRLYFVGGGGVHILDLRLFRCLILLLISRSCLLKSLKDRSGYSHLKEEALDRTVWRHRFGGGFGPVVRQNTE